MPVLDSIALSVSAQKTVTIADGVQPDATRTISYEVYEYPDRGSGPKFVLMTEDLFLDIVAQLDAARCAAHPDRSGEADLWQTKATPI